MNSVNLPRYVTEVKQVILPISLVALGTSTLILKCNMTNALQIGRSLVSIPVGVIGIFHRHNPSDRTLALESTQPLTEMSTGSISWG